MDNEDSDLTNLDDDEQENSHLQFEETDWFQGVHQITVVLPNESLILIKPLKKY